MSYDACSGRLRAASALVLLTLTSFALTALRADAQPLVQSASGAEGLRGELLLTVESGLSGTSATAVARAPGGYLWIGTQHGLDRYDGIRLRSFGEADDLPRASLRALHPDAHGGVWLGTTEGLAYLHPRSERALRPGGRAHPITSAPVRALAHSNGHLWVGTEGAGLYRLSGEAGRRPHLERLRFPSAADGRPLVSDTVLSVLPLGGSADAVLVGTARGLVRVDVAARRAVAVPLGPPAAVVRCVSTPDSGSVWCATATGEVYALSAEGQRATLVVATGLQVSVLALSAARTGILWVGARGQGLHALDLNTGTLRPVATALPALTRADVMSLDEDDEGTLWVGTLTGLFKLHVRPPRFAALSEAHGLAVPAVLAIHQPASEPDALWLGTMRGGLHRYDRRSGRMTRFFDTPGHRLSVIFALLEDRSGRFWIGATGGEIHRFDSETGQYTSVPLSPRPDAVVYSLYEAPSLPGIVWAGLHGAGLTAYDAERGGIAATFGPDETPPRRLDALSVWQVLEAPGRPGVLWVATSGEGLHRLDVRRLATERVRPEGCSIGDDVFALDVAADGSLWLGVGGNLLVRYDPASSACEAFPHHAGPADARRVFVAADGGVWVSTRTAGLFRFDPATRTYARFGAPDGVEGSAFFIPAGFRGPRGELYFGGLHGVSAVWPDAPEVSTPPPTALTRVLLEDQPVALEGRPLRLPAHRHDLTFEFAALSLRQPELNQYRVRLAGADDTWRTLHNETRVRYPFLAPGRYVFHVSGAGADGVWSPSEASFAFVIRPPFWRTGYFWTLIALVVGLGIVSGYQYRIRAIKRLELTRTRIADDLHDDIGSKVSAVALRLDLARRTMALSDAERQRLGDLAGSMREVVSDLRDIVWLVDSGFDDLASVVARMEQTATQMRAGRAGEFERPAVLPHVVLPMEQRRHLFLFYREALCNAVKHTQGPVHVQLHLADGRFRVRVTDEGPGFVVTHRSTGRGLGTLEKRARAQGGTYTVDSHPSRGTTVTLEVPLAGLRPLPLGDPDKPGARAAPGGRPRTSSAGGRPASAPPSGTPQAVPPHPVNT